jgi:hypothetical protein
MRATRTDKRLRDCLSVVGAFSLRVSLVCSRYSLIFDESHSNWQVSLRLPFGCRGVVTSSESCLFSVQPHLRWEPLELTSVFAIAFRLLGRCHFEWVLSVLGTASSSMRATRTDKRLCDCLSVVEALSLRVSLVCSRYSLIFDEGHSNWQASLRLPFSSWGVVTSSDIRQRRNRTEKCATSILYL